MCFSEIMKSFRKFRQIESIKKMNALYGISMTDEEIDAKAEANVLLEELNEDSHQAREEAEALRIARAALNPSEPEHIETNALGFTPSESTRKKSTRTDYSKTVTRAPHISKKKISEALKQSIYIYLMVDRKLSKASAEDACSKLNVVNYYLSTYKYNITDIEEASKVEDIVAIKEFIENIDEFKAEQIGYKHKLMKSLDYYTAIAILGVC